MTTRWLLVLAAALLAACGGGAPAISDGGSASAPAGACLSGATDCPDDPRSAPPPTGPTTGPDGPTSVPVAEYREQAQGLLGTLEADLPDDVRVARRGGERFALTEDYVIGRMTVELDRRAADGPFVVTAVTVELPGGPETFATDQPSP